MPRKRHIDVRLKELQDKMDRLDLEKKIKELRDKIPARRTRRRK